MVGFLAISPNGFIGETARRIKAKVEDLDEFKGIETPTEYDGQYLCQYLETQECGTKVKEWGVFNVVMNIFLIKENQKITKYRFLPKE